MWGNLLSIDFVMVVFMKFVFLNRVCVLMYVIVRFIFFLLLFIG